MTKYMAGTIITITILIMLINTPLSVYSATSANSIIYNDRSYVLIFANYDYDDSTGLPDLDEYTIRHAAERTYELLSYRYYIYHYYYNWDIRTMFNDEGGVSKWVNYELDDSELDDKVYSYDYIIYIGHGGSDITITGVTNTYVPVLGYTHSLSLVIGGTSYGGIAYPHGIIAEQGYSNTYIYYVPRWYMLVTCSAMTLSNNDGDYLDYAKYLFFGVDINSGEYSPIDLADRMYLHGVVGFKAPITTVYTDDFMEKLIAKLAVVSDDGDSIVDALPIIDAWFEAGSEVGNGFETGAALYPVVTIVAYKPGSTPTSGDNAIPSGFITVSINYGYEGLYPFSSVYHTPGHMISLLRSLGYSIVEVDFEIRYVEAQNS